MIEWTEPVGKMRRRPLPTTLVCAFLLAAALCSYAPMQLQAQPVAPSEALSGVKQSAAERIKITSLRDAYKALRSGDPSGRTAINKWIGDNRETVIVVATLIALPFIYLIAWIGESVYRRFFQKPGAEAGQEAKEKPPA